MPVKNYVFVYGTLRRGYWNHDLLGLSSFLGEAKTVRKGWLYVPNSIPFLNFDKNGEQVVGELYAVDDETLKDLDSLEGHPDFYRREVEEIEIDGGTLSANIYVYPHDLSNEKTRHYDFEKIIRKHANPDSL